MDLAVVHPSGWNLKLFSVLNNYLSLQFLVQHRQKMACAGKIVSYRVSANIEHQFLGPTMQSNTSQEYGLGDGFDRRTIFGFSNSLPYNI